MIPMIVVILDVALYGFTYTGFISKDTFKNERENIMWLSLFGLLLIPQSTFCCF